MIIRCISGRFGLTLASAALAALIAGGQPANAQQPPAQQPPTTPAAKPAAVPVAPYLQRSERTVRTLAPGVELIQEVVTEGPDAPLVVTAVIVDPKKSGVRIEAALGHDRVWADTPSQGRETVSALAKRRGALVALNAGFFTFSSGHPIGLHVENGDLITEPSLNRSALVLSADRAAVSTFTFVGEVAAPGGVKHTLHGLNRKPTPPDKGNELLLFSPRFRDRTLAQPGRVEVVLRLPTPGPLTPGKSLTGTVETVSTGGDTPIVPGTVVLSGGGAAGTWLRTNAAPGAQLSVRMEINAVERLPFPVADIRQAIQGVPRLLTGGQVTVRAREEGSSASFVRDLHPRTAAGITGDGRLVFLTVDGRQAGLSRGISLDETARWLLKFGAVDGVNLDGGGSTTLAVHGTVVNSPSGGAERSVANMFVVYGAPEAPADGTAVSGYTLSGPTAPLVVGQAVDCVVTGLPADAQDKVVWGVEGGAGFVSQSGRFAAVRPGTARVVAILPGNLKLVLPVTVQGAPKPPDLLPPGTPAEGKPPATGGAPK
jgi:Exopolysaccharide biosynthesis protein related to N-acetylglucosamine-1-phosphodiester alpha-N-acetylglucosaminidase